MGFKLFQLIPGMVHVVARKPGGKAGLLHSSALSLDRQPIISACPNVPSQPLFPTVTLNAFQGREEAH